MSGLNLGERSGLGLFSAVETIFAKAIEPLSEMGGDGYIFTSLV